MGRKMVDIDEKVVADSKARHVGKWIALKENKVLGTAEFHEELYKRLKPEELNGAYVFYSPTEEQKKYGFLF